MPVQVCVEVKGDSCYDRWSSRIGLCSGTLNQMAPQGLRMPGQVPARAEPAAVRRPEREAQCDYAIMHFR